MTQQNKALIRRAVDEVWNRGNYAALAEIVADDFVVHMPTPADDIHGRDGATRFFVALREAFPDLRFTVEDQIADGDRVVTRWTASGTHTGAFQGIPPTGTQVRLTGIDIDRIAGGEVLECWTSGDDLGLLRQLGMVPRPAQAA